MAATVSLSKGVFAFKKSKSKNKERVSFSSNDYWRQEDGRNDPDIQEQTLYNYQQCWSSVSKLIENFLDQNHAKVFEDLVRYIRRVGSSKCQSLLDESLRINKDIPAACLVTGVNMPDHATIFNSLTKAIKERVTPYVARLSTADCSSVKVAVFKLISSLMNEDDSYSFDSDSEDEVFIKSKSPTKKKNFKRTQCTMATLSSWYKETEMNRKNTERNPCSTKSPVKKNKTTPRKRSLSGNVEENNVTSPKKRPRNSKGSFTSLEETENCASDGVANRPVIVVLEEVESIPIQVFQDLILITSEYQGRIPFLFVFGVSTTPSYIHRHLSQEASSSVAMETFQAQPSSNLLSEVIEKILMNSSLPFRVGGKVFKLLLDIFLFHDLSVRNFIFGLKFCMLEHFSRGEGSFLCCEAEERESRVRNLSPAQVTALRNLASCKKLCEGLSAEEKKKIENDSYFCKQVLTYLDDFDSWYDSFCCLVKVLHCLVSTLPGTPLGRQVREIFSTCLSQKVTDMEEFQSAWRLLSMSAKEELTPRLQEAIQILNEHDGNEKMKELALKLSEFLARIENIENEVRPQEEEDKKLPFAIELKPSDRFHLREKLLGAQRSKARKSPFEELRLSILTCFEHVFISHLRPVHSTPFHEVFFFDSIANVKYQLLGSIRATITTGLADPQKYLQCTCCKLDSCDTLLTSLPDLSVCYKLHLECGRLINLYDWLQAFISVVSDEETQTPKKGKALKKDKKNAVDETIQARFIQAVSELQLLGFIKPTKRKTDHVQRLTWGGC